MDQPPVDPQATRQPAAPAARSNNTLRNVLLGCLGLFVVLSAVGGFLTYRFVVRPAQTMVRSVEQLGDLSALNERIQETRDFVIPENGLLTEAQLERFLAVQTSVREQMAGKFSDLQAQLAGLEGEELSLASLRQLLGSARELPALLREAKEAQVEALNQQGFSLKEYSWVKRESIRAVGASLQSIDFSEMLGDSVELPDVLGSVPEANRDLLAPYRERIEDVMGLALFGL